MRKIALGATYYHFASKEAIVLAFYELAKDEMSEPLGEAAKTAKNLQQGLRAALDIKFAYFAPNRKFLGALFPHAADPQDPLSPFSKQNRPIRVADPRNVSGNCFCLPGRQFPTTSLRFFPTCCGSIRWL